jgi:hypothetical protein
MAIIKPEQLSSGPYNISGSFSGSFQGDGSGLINIPTQSFETGSFVTTSSFNSFTGSYNTGSFTGSFTGNGSGLTGIISSSFALTASYAVSASYEINYETSSSYAETASVAISASYAETASFVQNAQTASYVLNAVSSSYALSASFAPSTPAFPFTGSALITGSLGVTGSLTTLGTSSITNPTQLSGNQTTSPLLTLNQSLQGFGNSSVMFRASETSVNNSFAVELYKRSGNSETRFLAGGNGTGTNTERSFMTVIGTNTAGDGSVTFDRSVGIGSTPSSSIRLDVRAQGALSTDTVFRVRNSADSNNIFTVSGNNTIKFLSQTSSFDGIVMSQGAFSAPIMTFTDQFSEAIRISTVTNVIKAGNFRMGAETGDGFGGLISTSTSPAQGRFFRIIDNFGNQWLNIGGSSYDGTDMELTMRASTNTNTNYIRFRGFGNANEVAISDQANVGIGGTSYGTSSKYVIAQYTGTAPTTSPVDAFQQYSADIVAGNAAPHFRTENGSIIKLYQQAAVTSSQGLADALTNLGLLTGSSVIPSGGPFGIANTSGSYTYYTTFSASMAAATSGQTVEMFADIIETGSVTITLKNGVNINGNGHTYTLNNSGTIHALSAPITVNTSCNVLNLNVVRTGSTGTITDNSALVLSTNGTGTINCAGSTFRNLGSGCGIVFSTNSGHEVNYAVAYATTTWGAIGIFTSYGAKLNNSIGYGTSGGYGIRCQNGGDIQNCTGTSDSGYGIYGLAGNQSNSVGISATGNGFFSAGISTFCTGRSTSGTGFEAINSTNIFNCTGISVSGAGFNSSFTTYNCIGMSSSGTGFRVQYIPHYNLVAKSISSYAVWNTNGNAKLYNAVIVSEWNNAAGYGIRGNGGFIVDLISNCTFNLSNTSAPYLFNDGTAQAISMRGNTYQGGATFNVNLTQAIVATEDAQGNIFL